MSLESSGAATFTRRGLLGLAAGAITTALAGGSIRTVVLERLRWGEDFFPGTAPKLVLQPEAWTTTDDSITFVVLGDNGTGGRNQMDVARQMALTYQRSPYGLVLLGGDISYYGSIDDRWEEVFVEPYEPLIDAGVEWQLAIGNHEISEKKSDYAVQEIQAQVRRFGKPGTYYVASHRPMDVFVLDRRSHWRPAKGGPSNWPGSSSSCRLRAPAGRWRWFGSWASVLSRPLVSGPSPGGS